MAPDARGDRRAAALVSATGRTDLAWARSALAFGAVGAAMLKGLAPIGKARPVVGVIAIFVGVAIVVLAAAYILRSRRPGASTRGSLMLVSAGTVAIGVLAIVIGATSP
jgi:uncharacterized membrane protein YidH (DUF202 family)